MGVGAVADQGLLSARAPLSDDCGVFCALRMALRAEILEYIEVFLVRTPSVTCPLA
jgi:hypothetical protein